jgi:galactoside O-acetyltransferase
VAFLPDTALRALGFREIGSNVLISDRASIYGAERISLGSNVRVDDFAVISAGSDGIEIGSYVHIAVSCSLIGSALIRLGDFSGLSARVAIYSSSDDYSGEFLTNPTVPAHLRGVTSSPVILGRHVIVGSGSVILPGVTVHEGASIGALSLVRKDCEAFAVYSGSPMRKVSERSHKLVELENQVEGISSNH